MFGLSTAKERIPQNLLLGATAEQKEIRLHDEDPLKHMVVIGRSGCGKTSFLLGLIYQQIQRGGGYIFIDGKLSRKTIIQIYMLSKLAMRESLFRILNPADSRITHTYNPLAKAVQDVRKSNVAESLIRLLDPTPEGSLAIHYHTLTLNLLMRTMRVFHAIGKAVTIRDVLEVLSHLDLVYPILAEEIKDANMMRDLIEYHKSFQKELSKAKNEKFEGLDAKINTLLATPAADALCSPGSDIDFYNAMRKNQNVYVGLPMDRDPSTGAGLGRLILTDIRFAIAEVLDHMDQKPRPPFLIIMDEFGSYATPDFSVVFEKSREANVIVVAAIQSLSNISDPNKMLSLDFAERILGNANKIFMAVESTRTAAEAEKYFGEDIAFRHTYQIRESETYSGRWLNPLRFINPEASKGKQDSTGWIEAWEPKVKADQFLHELDIGEAFVKVNGKPSKVKLIRADITVPEGFDITDDLPRFSQGEQEPLNLTEKVNREIVRRMERQKGQQGQQNRQGRQTQPFAPQFPGRKKKKKNKHRPENAETFPPPPGATQAPASRRGA